VGKTIVAAAIVAALRSRGAPAMALKPVLTGLDDPPDPVWPPDHELLARVCECPAREVALATYGPAVSPHLAAELSGRPLHSEELSQRIAARLQAGGPVIVEGVGGLLVPLGDGCDVSGVAARLGLPLVVAARPGLGTINHTLLTLEAARQRGLRVAGVVLTPWPRSAGRIEHSNLETIERLGQVEVSVLEQVERPDPELLADAGARLPLQGWLGPLPQPVAHRALR
jgi:dethiobiotin synthetase